MMSVTVGAPEAFVGKIGCFQIAQFVAVAHQVTQRLLGCGQNAFHNRISFRVNGRSIQWVIAMVDTQEACALFKGFWPQAAHF